MVSFLFSCTDDLEEVEKFSQYDSKVLSLENGESFNIAFLDDNTPVFENKDHEDSYFKFINENPNYGFFLSTDNDFYLLSSRESLEKYLTSSVSLKASPVAYLYDDEDYQDRNIRMTTTLLCREYSNFKRQNFNDKTSSVRFIGGHLSLYDDRDFEDRGWFLAQGGSQSFRSIRSLKRYGFNDKASSGTISVYSTTSGC